jgi:Anti-sigma-28 factor, FlgM
VDAYRATKIRELRELVERGAYSVDPDAVADAILLRLSGTDLVPEYAPPSRHTRRRRSAVLTGVTRPARVGRRGTVLAA